MNRLSLMASFGLVLILLSSCQMSRQLSVHQTNLKRLVNSNLSEQQKFDGLAEELVMVLEGAAGQASPLKTAKYLRKFSAQNKASLNVLYDDLDNWIKGMKPGRKIAFAAGTLSQPYARKLVQLIPEVEQRVKNGGYRMGTMEKILLLYRLRKMVKNNGG
ncbi:MAG: hypothetical protein AAF399_00360 [Bacteroidota bacterium]